MAHDHLHLARADRQHRLAVALAIVLVVFAIELVGGLLSNSLALLADAGHIFADALGIALSLFAVWIAGRPASSSRTFGYHRAEILAAVANAVLLVGVAIVIIVAACRRLSSAPEMDSGIALGAAALAIIGNGIALRVLHGGDRTSVNLRAATLEVLSDLIGAAAVIVSAGLNLAFGWHAADAIVSLAIAVFILQRVWKLLREATDVLLEATPRGVNMEALRRHLEETPGVTEVHDLHAWTITSGMPVLSAHVVLAPGARHGEVLDGLSNCISDHFDIEHSTFQLEEHDHRSHEGHVHT